MANTWQGEFPWQNLSLDGYERTSSGRLVPAQRIRSLRYGGERLGVDQRLVLGQPIGGLGEAVLWPTVLTWCDHRRELQSDATAGQDSAQSD
jgi:hypothetical protein